MKVSRRAANSVKFITDQLLPPVLRDSKAFGLFFLFCIFGRNYKTFFNFKKKATREDPEQIKKIYSNIYQKGIAIERDTDLNPSCMKYILNVVVGKNVLEVGCGRGLLVKNLVDRNKNLEISACDMVLGNDLFRAKGVKYFEADMESLPFKDKLFDTVITTHTLEHSYNILKAVSELRRVCRGRLIIVVPSERPYLYTPNLHLHFFPSADYLLNFLRGGKARCFDFDGDLIYVEEVAL